MPTRTLPISYKKEIGTDLIYRFFKAPDYDVAVLEYADANKKPIGITELLTVSAIPLTPFEFKGVAMVIAGQYDFIFCQSQYVIPGGLNLSHMAECMNANLSVD